MWIWKVFVHGVDGVLHKMKWQMIPSISCYYIIITARTPLPFCSLSPFSHHHPHQEQGARARFE